VPTQLEVEVFGPQLRETEEWAVAARGTSALFKGILKMAKRDLMFLRRIENSNGRMTKNQRDRRASILEVGSPVPFFAGEWFEEICEYLGENPEKIRRDLGLSHSDI
jgi:hypothetical protein